MKSVALLLPLTACFASDPAAPVCGPAPTTYRVDSVVISKSGSESRELGLDLNDDRTVDNTLGMFSGTLSGLFGNALDLEATANQHLATDTDWRIAAWQCDGGQQAALIEGAADPTDPYTSTDPTFEARGSGGSIPLGALWDADGTTQTGFVPVEVGAILLGRVDDDQLTARIAVAIDGEVALRLVVDGIAAFINEHLTGDLRIEVDANGDGAISVDELRHNRYVESLLAPDLEFDRLRVTSLGLRVHAVRVP